MNWLLVGYFVIGGIMAVLFWYFDDGSSMLTVGALLGLACIWPALVLIFFLAILGDMFTSRLPLSPRGRK